MPSPAPFFSVIAPAYNVEGTIRTALNSVLTQTFADFELIVVDDLSPDASGAIADEVALLDGRVHVIHSLENQGLGLARNRGMEDARGDYILFLDTDDFYEVGALQAIHDRLVETSHPEVLMFDYERTYWSGERKRNVKGFHLAERDDQPWTLSEHPELLEILNVAWNKAYSKGFLARTGLQFPDGIYEDIPWTYPVLLEAQSIATLDMAVMGYRQSRGGSILRSSSAKHLDVVKQWDRLMHYLADHPEHERWTGPLYDRLASHLVTLAGNDAGRIPAESWNTFLLDVGRCLAEHKPPDHAFWSRMVAVRAEVLMRQQPAAFKGLKAVNGTRISARNAVRTQRKNAQRGVRQVKNGIVASIYHAALALPIDENLAIFSAYWSKQYAGSPKAIYEEMRRRPDAPRCVWIFDERAPIRFPGDGEWVRRGSPDYYWLLGRAKYLINNVNFADFVTKRPASVHLQTQHGTPLKSMGLDLRHYPTPAKGMRFDALLERADRWDLNLSSNRYSTEIWARAFPCPFTSFESGYPRNDVLVRNATDEEARRAARIKLGVRADSRVLLYMPTFRDYDDGFEVDINLDELATALGPDWTVLTRAHYFYDAVLDRSESRDDRADLVDISKHPTVEDAYLASDVLLTDYSSAMFDFAVLDRPIVLFVPDWDRYREERGIYFDVRETPPGPVTTTTAELLDVLATGQFNDEASTLHRAKFRCLFCEFDDGFASRRVVDRLLLGKGELRWPSKTDLSALKMYPTLDWAEPA